jgi:fused signal recognition particle receptor
MAELAKIGRVLAKLDPSAPHEVLMVIDGTTGQNAVSQVRQFLAAARVTGLAITKLDGSAKGGVVFALAREFGLPIRFVGLGERIEDLREFDPEAFVDALLPEPGAERPAP